MAGKLIGLSIALGVVVLCAEVEHKESKQMTYAVGGSPKLIVDNVWGGIRVKAHPGREIRVSVQEHWTADTQDELSEARRTVKLDATQNTDTVKLLVNGPFRCNGNDGGVSFRGRPQYRVRYEFEIYVPVDAVLNLRTVNQGSITAQGTRGDLEISNVNGGIDLVDVAGSGTVRTVNGPVQVTFSENPKSPVLFKTVNGQVTVEFQPDMSADLRFKTMHGQVYTDYEVTPLPAEPVKLDRSPGKTVYRMNQFTGVRVGAGGPEHRFETLNGSIRILKRGR
jgi:hypothetical protein